MVRVSTSSENVRSLPCSARDCFNSDGISKGLQWVATALMVMPIIGKTDTQHYSR